MGTLFECLKEARLEKYYPAFRNQGITKSETLTQLTIHDCPAFGITAAEDKRRLVDLINIVKAVHNTERDYYSPGSASNRSSQNTSASRNNKVPRKRNRSPAVASAQQTSGRSVPAAVSNVRVRDRSHAGLSLAGAAFLGLMSDDSSEASSSESAEHSDYEPAVKHSVPAEESRDLPLRARKTPVEKVKHGAGYNYGVPGTTGARPKTRGGSAGRVHEDKIKVCVRKRPISKKEVKSGEEDLIHAVSTTTLSLAEPKQAVDLTAYTLQHEFIFDEVFDESCSNEDVYIRAARPLINCIFDGGSATCFAYGQTGAGKTHTMIGNENVPGLYLLAAHDIFSIINSRQYGPDIRVWVSFFEIYCGQLFDLLNKRNRLHVREDGSQRVCIAGLTETEAKDEQNLMQVLEYGNAVRSKGASGVNPDSSRSHAVLQMEIRDQEDKRLGRISFIDLAGSERASDSGEPDRQTRMEGAEINQSLLALKECIRSIDQESRHKPFRQSKLTHILKDSFMGNSRTCMIANISPASASCEHTLNTLRYADRVKELRKNTSASTSRSMNVAMSNILMNIPASGPSLFQPSNILCSSTPMRQSTRKFTNRDTNSSNSSELHLDPSETPIRGPGVRRKTANAGSKPDMPAQNVHSRSSGSASSRSSVVRHVASNSNTNNSNIAAPVATSSVSKSMQVSKSQVQAKSQNNVSSNSESDQTDTDSCNVTGQQKPVNFTQFQQNVVSKPAANKQGNMVGKSSQNIPVVKSTDTENDFPTTDFNDEECLNDLNRTSGKNPVTASVPVFPTGAHKQAAAAQSRPQQEKMAWAHPGDYQFKASSVSASVPVLRKKNYVDSQNSPKNDEEEKVPVLHTTKQNDINSRPFNQMSVQAPSSKPESHTAPSQVRQDGRVSSSVAPEIPQRETTPAGPSQARAAIPSLLMDSVDDDMLFDPPSVDQKLWTPRTPSESSGTQPKFPQNPSLQPEIPAVLPAKSTDLTTFSQRSPRWQQNQINKNPNQYTTPPQPQNGYRPEPVKAVPEKDLPKNNAGAAALARQQAAAAAAQASTRNTPNQPNNPTKVKDNVTEQNGQHLSHRVPKQKDVMSSPGVASASNAPYNFPVSGQPIGRKTDLSKPQKDAKDPKEPISATWFNTPVDHDTHISRSVNPGKRNSIPNDQSDRNSSVSSVSNKSDSRSAGNQLDNDRTDVKELDNEFLPLQRNKSSRSDSGMVSAMSDHSASSARTKKDPNTAPGPHQAGYFSDSTGRPRLNINQSSQSRSRVVHSPVMDKLMSYNNSNSITSETTRHKVVHSPVNQRQDAPSSPIIRDYPSSSLASRDQSSTDSYAQSVSQYDSQAERRSLANDKQAAGGSGAVKTEKLQTGSMFSPIHPQPVTGSQATKISGAVSKDILHPTPVPSKGSGSGDKKGGSADGYTDSNQIDLKSQLISSHEDQLATVTSLCKQEMKLLLGAKAGSKSFEEYMRRVSDVLTQKMSAIQLLQDQIIAYQLSTQDSNHNSPR